MNGSFVISLDFELLWGVRDHFDKMAYGTNVLGARKAIPRILDIFAKNEISATWAIVGFLFCENKEELLNSVPDEQPRYVNSYLSNYQYIHEVGENEAVDPYYFAPSLIHAINQTPGQEIGTHTLSHYYCLEDGQAVSAFEADIVAAKKLAASRGIDLKSIVFPRNQFATEHLEVCMKHGINHYRGNASGWAYRATKGAQQTYARRALRLIDAYSGILGPQTFEFQGGYPQDIPASSFLRPNVGRLAAFQPMHIATIKHGMTAAAKSGAGYHLWWHPHNFGCNLEDNLVGLSEIISHFSMLSDSNGMRSVAMRDY